MDGDGTGLTLHFLALPGQVTEFLTVYLQRGVHGRDLEDLTPERFQDLLQLLPGKGHFPLLQGLAPDVFGGGG